MCQFTSYIFSINDHMILNQSFMLDASASSLADCSAGLSFTPSVLSFKSIILGVIRINFKSRKTEYFLI